MFRLESPESFRRASIEDRADVANGCGPEGASKIVPDFILGVDVSEACEIHDWEYQHGEDLRSIVDARFHRNMRTLIDAKGAGPLRWARRCIAWWYHRSVTAAGDRFFGGMP